MIRNEPSIPFPIQITFEGLYPAATLEDWYRNDWGAVELCFMEDEDYVVAFFFEDGEWIMSDHYLSEEETPYFIDYYLEALEEDYFSAITIKRETADGDCHYVLEVEPEADQPPLKLQFAESGELLAFWQVWREELFLN